MYELRDRMARASGMELIVYRNPEALARGINPFDQGSLRTDMWKTEGLRQALDKYGFDAAFGGARRDEENSRAKERVFSFRSANREHHADLKGQKPAVLWLTGLSGAGKSTIANLVEKTLARMNRHTFLLDGDNVRHTFNKDLGFTEADRIENIRRVGEVSKPMTDAGLIVIVSFISPFRAEWQMVRDMMPGEFFEIYVDTPIADAEKRDVKGLYKKARAGQLKNFTGIDSPYEVPTDPR